MKVKKYDILIANQLVGREGIELSWLSEAAETPSQCDGGLIIVQIDPPWQKTRPRRKMDNMGERLRRPPWDLLQAHVTPL